MSHIRHVSPARPHRQMLQTEGRGTLPLRQPSPSFDAPLISAQFTLPTTSPGPVRDDHPSFSDGFNYYQPTGQDKKLTRVAEAVRFAEDEKRRAFDKMLSLEDRLEFERTRAGDIEHQLQMRERARIKAEGQNEKLREELLSAQQQADSARSDAARLSDAHRRIAQLEQELSEARERGDDALKRQRDVEASAMRCGILERELQNTRDLLASAQKSLGDVATKEASRFDDATLRWEVLDVNNKRRIAELEDTVARMQTAADTSSDDRLRLSDLEARLKDVLADNRHMQQQLRHMEPQLSAAQERIRSLEDQLQQKDDAYAALASRLAQEEAKVHEKDRLINSMQHAPRERVTTTPLEPAPVASPQVVMLQPIEALPSPTTPRAGPLPVALPHYGLSAPNRHQHLPQAVDVRQLVLQQQQAQPQPPLHLQHHPVLQPDPVQYYTPPTEPPPLQAAAPPRSQAAVFTPVRSGPGLVPPRY